MIAYGRRECIRRDFGNGAIDCVCNITYCDDFPKLVKEKALAEYHLSSSSTENDDPSSSLTSSSPSCIPSIKYFSFPFNFIFNRTGEI